VTACNPENFTATIQFFCYESEEKKARKSLPLLAEGSLERAGSLHYLQFISIFNFGGCISHLMTGLNACIT